MFPIKALARGWKSNRISPAFSWSSAEGQPAPWLQLLLCPACSASQDHWYPGSWHRLLISLSLPDAKMFGYILLGTGRRVWRRTGFVLGHLLYLKQYELFLTASSACKAEQTGSGGRATCFGTWFSGNNKLILMRRVHNSKWKDKPTPISNSFAAFSSQLSLWREVPTSAQPGEHKKRRRALKSK